MCKYLQRKAGRFYTLKFGAGIITTSTTSNMYPYNNAPSVSLQASVIKLINRSLTWKVSYIIFLTYITNTLFIKWCYQKTLKNSAIKQGMKLNELIATSKVQ